MRKKSGHLGAAAKDSRTRRTRLPGVAAGGGNRGMSKAKWTKTLRATDAHATSKGAPAPVARQALREAADDAAGPKALAGDADGRRRRLLRARAVARRAAVAAADACDFPRAVVVEAGVAGAVLRALGVEAGVLVEGDGVRRVLGAEDVSAASAVVASLEEGELLVTDRGITFHRSRIRLMIYVSVIMNS